MVQRKREILIKVENSSEISELLEEIKEIQIQIRVLFKHYENLSGKESDMLENWNIYLEDILQKIDHLTV